MPKSGLPASVWRHRLQAYADHSFVFSRGQHPPKDSNWHRELLKIDRCPRYVTTARRDILGAPILCRCGYHTNREVQTSSSAVALADPSAAVSMSSAPGQPPMLGPSTEGVETLKEEWFAEEMVDIDIESKMRSKSDIVPVIHGMGHEVDVDVVATEGSKPSPSDDVSPPSRGNKATARTLVSVDSSVSEYLTRIPAGWEGNMKEGDRLWVAKAVFARKGQLKEPLQLWYHPPPTAVDTTKPNVRSYFPQRLFLWMPRRMYSVNLECPTCHVSLRSKGVYNRVRPVLDVKDFYYLACEYMNCRRCQGTFLAYDSRMTSQLTDGMRALFPVLLTWKYACDRSVVSMLRARTLGNSPTALHNSLRELHSEEWLRKQLVYLSDCRRHRDCLEAMKLIVPAYQEAEPFKPLPGPKWFLASYVRDVLERQETLKAAITSICGTFLKIDSTKKVCRKLQGFAAGSAQWATNVGNEKGEILQSVLTTSESIFSLKPMTHGLMKRFEDARQDPPLVLYTDRECCSLQGHSKFKVLFSKWPSMEVRLDIWHFMRRLAVGCSTESHPLYGTFMSRLSRAIFQWDKSDLDKLKEAKKKEMVRSGVSSPSDSAVDKAITKQELASHCRRRTRGLLATEMAIEELILSLSGVTDALGVCLFKDELQDIWKEQKRHISCIQDPPGVQLYFVTGHLKKGGVELPVFRCARGSTSLESFHLHLNRFIPGTSAGAVNFQAYLLDGITRWNLSRTASAADVTQDPLRTFDLRLLHKVNNLSAYIHKKALVPVCFNASKYTGESVGVEFLFDQTGLVLPTEEEELNKEIDEGFGEDDTFSVPSDDVVDIDEPVAELSSDSEAEDASLEEPASQEEDVEPSDESTDSRGIPGWDKVDALAQALVSSKGISIRSSEADKIKGLYDQLIEYDRRPVTYSWQVPGGSSGRFGRSKFGHKGVEAVKRSFLSGGVPALAPDKSRVMEAVCIHLANRFTQPQKEGGYQSRWRLILSEYNRVRQRLLNSESLLDATNLVLLPINEATLVRWHKNQTRRDEVSMLLQGVKEPSARRTAPENLPAPRATPSTSPLEVETPLEFPEPEDTTGQADTRTHRTGATADAGGGPSSSSVSTPHPSTSRTTLWRKRKKEKDAIQKQTEEEVPTPCQIARKDYSCRICGRAMTSEGHTQFRGQRYCPNMPGQIPKGEWLQKKREEAAAKKASTK